MGSSLRHWLQVSFLNLLLVSLLGVLLRYKIAFSFPYFNQKYLLHGHSHFAFAGWITQSLMVLMVQWLSRYKGEIVFKEYRLLLYGNLITAYGMLIAFPLQGYAFWSICFSTLSIFVSYFFAIRFWKDLNRLTHKSISHYWYKAALIFSVISSLGAFSLAFMMANKIMHEKWYLGAVYFFLHFQYNGWFFFAGMGLLVSILEKMIPAAKTLKIIFWLFCLACGPAYFLSALWMEIPLPIYWLVILAAIAQVAGWALYVKLLLKEKAAINTGFPVKGRQLLLLSAIALTIKLLLQLGSTHPALSQLAFGFRPIVIGYLHLVLLGVVTIFILGYIISMKFLTPGKYFKHGVWIFISGIIINEILLMLQGVTGMSYHIIPYINESLFGTAIILFFGLILLNWQIRDREQVE
jgi:hypothetical protein